jgi:xylulokinase
MMGERSPVWDTNARGVFIGLSLSTSKGDLIRAILEGTAFALNHNVEIANRAGITINEIRSTGGGTKSALWNQIKADVLGIPVLIPETSIGAPFGDALLAGIGLGIYPDINRSLKEMIQIKARYEPDLENHKIYKELFDIYKALYGNLKNEFDRLASFRST